MAGRVEAEHVASAARPDQFPEESLPEVAFVGRSNVGKSSLLNALTGHKGLAFTSSRPGCTQVINFYRVDRTYYFVDLPGYGYARVPDPIKARWKRLIESYLNHRKTLKLLVLLLDARQGWTEADLQLREWLQWRRLPYLVVATKIDKLNRREQERGLLAMQQQAGAAGLIPCSAIDGRGVRELWQAISKIRNN